MLISINKLQVYLHPAAKKSIMKSYVFLFVTLLCGSIIFVGTSDNKDKPATSVRPITDIIECQSNAFYSPPPISNEEFQRRFGLEPMKTRKNVNALTQAEINAIKVGLLKMKALPYTNPTSFGYQTAIHGTNLPDNLQSWNTCHRAGEGVFFLAWHRMYLYFFERILRHKSGRADLTLPYWDYLTDPVLPAAYRENSPGNPLYMTRNAAINGGGALPASIITAFNNSMAIVPYYTFQSNLNSGPHGSVHTSVNGAMAIVNTAAVDPVFWLHHSEIDRLWEVWRAMCNGRANPVDATWLNKSYVFFDEFGNQVSLTGSQVVEISAQLNYRYDDLPSFPGCPPARPAVVRRDILITRESAVQLNGKRQKADFARESSTQIDSFIRRNNREAFNFSDASTSERLIMTFEGLAVRQMPEGVVEVYINQPDGQTPDFRSIHFVGLLDLFSAEHHTNHHFTNNPADEVELDATKVAEALGLNLNSLRNASVSFYVRGATLNRIEVGTDAEFSIRRIKFSLERSGN